MDIDLSNNNISITLDNTDDNSIENSYMPLPDRAQELMFDPADPHLHDVVPWLQRFQLFIKEEYQLPLNASLVESLQDWFSKQTPDTFYKTNTPAPWVIDNLQNVFKNTNEHDREYIDKLVLLMSNEWDKGTHFEPTCINVKNFADIMSKPLTIYNVNTSLPQSSRAQSPVSIGVNDTDRLCPPTLPIILISMNPIQNINHHQLYHLNQLDQLDLILIFINRHQLYHLNQLDRLDIIT